MKDSGISSMDGTFMPTLGESIEAVGGIAAAGKEWGLGRNYAVG